MDRDYARSLKALREVTLDARRTGRDYSFLGSTFRETRAYFPGLRSMLREKSDSGLAKRLTTMGGILILLPIPIVTEVLGAVLLATGFVLKKITDQSPTLGEIIQEFDSRVEKLLRHRET